MMDPKELMAEAAVLEPQLQNWRRTLHRHPEVGFDLPKTRALVKQALTEMGYTPQDCGKAGILVLAGGKSRARPFCCAATWTLCPFRRSPAWTLPLRCPAGCTAAATTCTRP